MRNPAHPSLKRCLFLAAVLSTAVSWLASGSQAWAASDKGEAASMACPTRHDRLYSCVYRVNEYNKTHRPGLGSDLAYCQCRGDKACTDGRIDFRTRSPGKRGQLCLAPITR